MTSHSERGGGPRRRPGRSSGSEERGGANRKPYPRGAGQARSGTRRRAEGSIPDLFSRGGNAGAAPTRSGHGAAQRREAPPRPRHRTLADEIRAVARPGQGEKAARAFEQAVSLVERGRDAAAVTPALEAKELAPRSGAVREILGIALYRAGRYREALRELQAYRRLTGRGDQDHLIADSYRGIGAPEKAVETARASLRAHLPEEVRAEAAVVAASALADLERWTEALSLLRSVRPNERSARRSDLRVWYVTGDILERSGRRDEARNEFSRIVRHDPEAFDAAERLASLS